MGDRNVRRFAPNLKLNCGDTFEHWEKIMKEVRLKRFVGPFEQPPYQYFMHSPVGLVPKSNGDTRLIFHLSYPRGGVSVNSGTPTELCKVKYNDLTEAIKMCFNEGKGFFTAKADMQSAFRNLPIKPEDWPLLIMKAEHPISKRIYYFVDKCLSFGPVYLAPISMIFKCGTTYIQVQDRKESQQLFGRFFLCCAAQANL